MAAAPKPSSNAAFSRRAWLTAVGLGLVCVAVGTAGWLTEGARNAPLVEPLIYSALPSLLVATVVVSRGSSRRLLLAAVFLLDLEAALLGAGPSVDLPFVVAVPLITLTVAARVAADRRELRIAYLAAWISSCVGIGLGVAGTMTSPIESTLSVIPAFMIADAFAVSMLWRMDARRARALAAAAEAEARFRDLLNGVDLFGVHVDRNSRIDFINDFALKLSGWRREEVLGADWWDTFATPERREAARATYSRIIAEKGSMLETRESEVLTKSGEVRLIRWSHVTRHGPDGSVTGVASLGEDVTASRAAEEERRRGAELVSNVVLTSPLPTAIVAIDRTVQLWNPAAEELLGWKAEEVVGLRAPAILAGSGRWHVNRLFVKAARGEPLDHELLELRARDGRTVRVRLYGGVLRDSDGRPIAVALQAVDMTLALAMEEKLRESAKMEAVGRLAGGVAHDFNNSLTAIGGFASMIASSSQEEESREAAATILEAAKRAAELTRELLAYSRRSLLQPETIELNALIGSLRPMVTRLLGEDITVVVESSAAEAHVRVDPAGLERVILNLAANARDAMATGGRFTIAIDRRSEAGADGNRQWVGLCVKDTGIGIPSELHSQVFDPFFTTKPVGSGTGLGLAMVKGFVVQSGGQVGLLSEPGLGTTIEILLPAVTAARTKGPERTAKSPSGGDETILVVEDEPAVAAITFQVLSRSGYHVLLADCGEAAIGLLKSHHGQIALLLLDVMLPDIRGTQLAELARMLHPESAVLFASGYSPEALTDAGGKLAEIDLVTKPYVPSELVARVRQAIDRSARGGRARRRADRERESSLSS